MKWNWKNPHCETARRSTHEGWRRESTGRAGCDTARCQTRCTASLGTWACCSDRVWCDTCGNASAPPCSTCLRTPACGRRYILVVCDGQSDSRSAFRRSLSLGAVALPLCWLHSCATSPGAVRPRAPLTPTSVHCLWEFAHNHTLSWYTPLRQKRQDTITRIPRGIVQAVAFQFRLIRFIKTPIAAHLLFEFSCNLIS